MSTLTGERLESRRLLASHPGFVYDSNDTLVTVDPAVQAKIGDVLALIAADYEGRVSPGGAYSPPAATPQRKALTWNDGVSIAVTAVAEAGAARELITSIEVLGGVLIASYDDQISAAIPFGALDELAAIPSLRYADAATEHISNVNFTNQADTALKADVARARFGVDGGGVRVGVISDSFDTLGGYAFDVASGALPANLVVLKEYTVTVEDGQPQLGTDEGRAMAQLVHSVAPRAELFFASSGVDAADFADSIAKLVAAGCEIIVDDITEGGVPWFQDGVVAQAVNAAVEDAGVMYLTSAGNFGRNSYGSDFRGVAAADLDGLPGELGETPGFVLHDFDPGPAVDVFQQVVIPAGTNEIRIVMQWDQPWGHNRSDVDLFIYAADGATLLDRLEGSHATGADPVLGSFLPVPAGISEVQLVIAHAGGAAPGFVKYVTFHTDVEIEYGGGSSTIVGHANSAAAAAVGASSFFRTPAYRQTPAELASYSSWGGTPILFAADGQRLDAPVIRQQPRFVAPSFGNTSFFGSDVDLDGLPNFSGTSAAAPNAAGVAALIRQLDPTLTSADVFAALAATASDMGDAGSPLAAGAGLINANAALARVAGIAVSGTVFEDGDEDGIRSPGELPQAGVTVFLDLNENGQRDRAPAADAEFSYLGFTAPSPLAIGNRSLIVNPNEPNEGPLNRPFTASSAIEVSGLPGVVADLEVVFSLRSDRTVDNQLIGPLFLTLVSPMGIRVPLEGSSISGNGDSASPYTVDPTMLPADGRLYSKLVRGSEFSIPESLNGSGHAVLSQVDLGALVGSVPNGRWQLEVQSADSDPARTATLDSWELYLQTAEPVVLTDADGAYAFTELAPNDGSVPISPRLLVPTGRRLLAPQTEYAFSLGVGETAAGADFAITVATGRVDAVVDVAVGQTARETIPRSGDLRLIKRGSGRLVLDAANDHRGGTVVEAGELVIRDLTALGSGGLQVLAGARVVLDVGEQRILLPSLALSPAATLDLTAGSMLLAAGSYDLSAIKNLIRAGTERGLASGPGITSTGIESGYFRRIGYRLLPDGALAVGFAAVGDATLDGCVSVFDLIVISASGVYEVSEAAAGWWQGDFNADGVADHRDLLELNASGRYGSGPDQPNASAPNPTVATLSEAVAAPSPAAAQELFRIEQLVWLVIEREDESSHWV